MPDGSIHQYDQILKYFNDQPADQTKPRGNRITFVTTGIIGFDGGQTTMLHLGTLLANAGYDVYYLSYVPQSQDEMIQNAEFNYPGYKGTCLPMGELESHRSDIWVATLWESVYVIKNKPGYKMYFVQDYEPYFYPYGDRYQMARRTYSLGLHMVSLGPWCAHMITMHCKVHSPIDVINFPVDVARYPFKERDMGPYQQRSKSSLLSIPSGAARGAHPSTFRLSSKIAASYCAPEESISKFNTSVPAAANDSSMVKTLVS